MAKPITLEIAPRDPRQELFARLQNAPMEHAEAILEGYEVLQSLHESGALDALRGALGSKDKIIDDVVAEADKPASVRAMRNLMVLMKCLGEIDPAVMGVMTRSFSEACAKTAAQADDPPGFWALLTNFRSKDLRRGLMLVNSLLERFGINFLMERNKKNEQK